MCAEPAWRLARAFLVSSFIPATRKWLKEGFEVNDDSASRINGAASIFQVYLWKSITSLKEALREGVDEDTLLWVWRALLDLISIFRTSIGPLLDSCEKNINFLSQTNRFVWYQVTLRYCMGILVLDDALGRAARTDFLEQLLETRHEVERGSFRVLNFGTENVCRIPGMDSHLPIPGGDPAEPAPPIQRSYAAMYTDPQHIRTVVQLLTGIIMRDHGAGILKQDVFAHLLFILARSTSELAGRSEVAQAA